MNQSNKSILASCVASALLLTGCGGSGESEPEREQILRGVFVDSPIQGLRYDTQSQSGITDNLGGFSYLEGESVVFSIGGLELPEVVAQETLTPLEIADSDRVDSMATVNILRLLQSMDDDSNPGNGITIPPEAHENVTAPEFNFSATLDFEAVIRTALTQTYGTEREIVEPQAAVDHLIDTLSELSADSETSSWDLDFVYLVEAGEAFNGAYLSIRDVNYEFNLDNVWNTGVVEEKHGVYRVAVQDEKKFLSLGVGDDGDQLACLASRPYAVGECAGDGRLFNVFSDESTARQFAENQLAGNTIAGETDTRPEPDFEAARNEIDVTDGGDSVTTGGATGGAGGTTTGGNGETSGGTDGSDNGLLRPEDLFPPCSDNITDPDGDRYGWENGGSCYFAEATGTRGATTGGTSGATTGGTSGTTTGGTTGTTTGGTGGTTTGGTTGTTTSGTGGTTTGGTTGTTTSGTGGTTTGGTTGTTTGGTGGTTTGGTTGTTTSGTGGTTTGGTTGTTTGGTGGTSTGGTTGTTTSGTGGTTTGGTTGTTTGGTTGTTTGGTGGTTTGGTTGTTTGGTGGTTTGGTTGTTTGGTTGTTTGGTGGTTTGGTTGGTTGSTTGGTGGDLSLVTTTDCPADGALKAPVTFSVWAAQPAGCPWNQFTGPVWSWGSSNYDLASNSVTDNVGSTHLGTFEHSCTDTATGRQITVTATCTVTVDAAPGVEDITDLFFLTGQANASGSETAFDPNLDGLSPQVFAFTDAGWQLAELYQFWEQDLPGNHAHQFFDRSPYNNIAFQVAKSLAAKSDRVIGIVMLTAPGEGISHWDYNSEFFIEMRNKATAALNALPQKSAFDSILWLQGETDWLLEGTADPGATGFSDTNSDFYRNYYPNKLNQLIGNFRSEGWFGSNGKFLCAETKKAAVNTHLMALNSDNDSHTGCAPASDLATRDTDPYGNHFSADALRILGGRIADVYLGMTP